MPAVEPVNDTDKLEAIQPLIETCEENGTPGPTFFELIGHRPEIASTFLDNWNATFYGGTVDHCLKELVRLHLANLHECSYCGSVGSNRARDLGLTDDKVRALEEFETDDRFTEKERAALRFAEDFFHGEHTFDELREHFDDGEIMELLWFVGLQDAGEKVVSSLGLKASCKVANLGDPPEAE
jgi:Uncharacterized conserved protein